MEQSPMKDMRTLINLVEARLEDPHVDYEQDATKVTARLGGYQSAKYTRLLKNMMRIDELTAELKQLQSEVKQQRREDVAELFDVEDAVFTRVVETKSAVFKLTKDPKPTESPQYKVILEALEAHLTPELITVLTKLKKEHVTVTQKEPALSYELTEEVNPSVLNSIKQWLPKFDRALDVIEQAID